MTLSRSLCAAALVTLPLAAGCSDYSVERSELMAASESAEILLTDGTSTQLVATLVADAEALGANPSSQLGLTLFGVMEAGSPRMRATAEGATSDVGVAPTAFLELEVEEPFRRCGAPEEDGPAMSVDRDGACTVSVPVDVSVEGGDLSFQLDAEVVMVFGRGDAPGTLSVSVDG